MVTGLNSLAALVTVACFLVIREQEKIAKEEMADSSDANGKSEDVAAGENDEGDGKDE